MHKSDPTQSNFVYTYDDSAGEGVDIYIVDTVRILTLDVSLVANVAPFQGVRITHTEFGGRASFAKTFGPGVPGQDIQGHGRCWQTNE